MAKGNYLKRLLSDLGISETDLTSAVGNLEQWAKQVKNIESDNNPMASPGTTSAKGVYQFVDDSVPVGKQRMKNMGFSDKYVNSLSDNPQEWSSEDADAIFFGNVFAQEGSDPFIKEIAKGNQKARRDAYYKFHHTAPDEATISRAEKFIPVPNQPVDALMEEVNKVENIFAKP